MEEEEEAAQIKEKQQLAGLAKYRKRNLQQKNYEETLFPLKHTKVKKTTCIRSLLNYNNTKNEINYLYANESSQPSQSSSPPHSHGT